MTLWDGRFFSTAFFRNPFQSIFLNLTEISKARIAMR